MENINLKDPAIKALDDVSAWLSDAKSSEFGFIKATHTALVMFIEHGNRDPLAKLLTVVNGKTAKRIRNVEGQKMVFAAPLKRILSHVLPNTTAKYSATSDFGVAWSTKTKANQVSDADMLAKLESLVADAVSPFSKTFKETFPPITKTKAELDAEAKAAKGREMFLKYAAKMQEEYGFSKAVLQHMLDSKDTNKVEPNF